MTVPSFPLYFMSSPNNRVFDAFDLCFTGKKDFIKEDFAGISALRTKMIPPRHLVSSAHEIGNRCKSAPNKLLLM